MNFIAIKKHDSAIKYTLLFFLFSIDLFHKTHKQFISLLSCILPLSTLFLFSILQFPFFYTFENTLLRI